MSTKLTNQPEWAGYLATRKVLFGDANRYAVYALHTNSKQVVWVVDDAEFDATDGSLVRIREAKTFRAAVRGLEGAPKTPPV
jgi:hypothetical protein